jgi:DNA (cytosine-5)-methyltransferase 3A
MEKIVPSASAVKAKATKKDQYLLKRRDPPPPALDDGPPGFGADPPTPPLPGSTAEDEDFMLQSRAPPVEVPPPAAQAAEGGAAGPKKANKREPEEASAAPGADAEPKKKKKKKLTDINGGAAPKAPSAAAGSGKSAGFPAPKVVGDLDGLDLKQLVSDLPISSLNGAEHRISDTARSFVLAFRSKYFKKSYENDPPEEPKKNLSLDKAAADRQLPKKKKLEVRPAGDPTKAGVKRAPSDRQEEMTLKKKAKIDKIKTLSSEKKAGGLELQKPTGTAAAGATRPAAMKEKAEGAARKKAPAPRMKTLSPTALMMKFPLNSTLPSVASLKARFARFGPLDVDGIRVYWKSNMCRVIYRFRSDAETALKYARTNPMFGQVDAQFHIKEVEKSGGSEPQPPALDAPLQRSSDLRLMETAPFRPGTSGNGSPLPMSRAVPARTTTAMGQLQPKSILKKSTDEGGNATREGSSRVKFMLDAGDNKLEPSAQPTSAGNGGDSGAPVRAKSVGFAPQPPLQPPARTLQPPMRPAQQPLQPPRAAITQPLPPMPHQARTSDGGLLPPQGQLPYPPRHTDGPPAFSTHPSQQQLLYPPRHNDGMSALPGQPPLPYQPRFPSQQQQQPPPYPPPHSGDSQPMLIGQPQQYPPSRPGTSAATEGVPAWKTSKEEFKNEVWRVMTRIAELVEPLTDKNGFFPYHLFGGK